MRSLERMMFDRLFLFDDGPVGVSVHGISSSMVRPWHEKSVGIVLDIGADRTGYIGQHRLAVGRRCVAIVAANKRLVWALWGVHVLRHSGRHGRRGEHHLHRRIVGDKLG